MDVLFSGCGPEKVYDRKVIPHARFFEGFTFSTDAGTIHMARTLRHLSPIRFALDIAEFDAAAYDLVITDFEPVSSMVARTRQLPSIGIGHQYAFRYDIPMDSKAGLSLQILKYFAPACYSIGLHWHHFGQPIVPPVVPPLVTGGAAPSVVPTAGTTKIETNTRAATGMARDDLVLVYLPFESSEGIMYLLKEFTGTAFAIYGSEPMFPSPAHLEWHDFSKTRFYEDLAACAGVICNAGFELPSEALNWGKKLLVKPLKGQFEQASNALALAQLGLGTAMGSLDRDAVRHWLAQKESPSLDFPDMAQLLADWILQGDWVCINRLVRRAWN